MRVVVTSNNAVRLSFLKALLMDAGLAPVVLDEHASIMDGSIGAIQRRLMVPDEDYAKAKRILSDSGES
jgi:Putative prokaryotic signal transducing protein